MCKLRSDCTVHILENEDRGWVPSSLEIDMLWGQGREDPHMPAVEGSDARDPVFAQDQLGLRRETGLARVGQA